MLEEHIVASDLLGNERRVWVYRPAGVPEGVSEGVMVLLDGWEWTCALPAAPTFDNLIAEGAIPPLAVVMPESLDHLVRGRELPCNPDHARFLADELLPWARSRWDLTDDPSRTIVAGQSYGGLASAFTALERPDAFGNVVSQSGSFWWRNDSEFDEEAEMLTRRFSLEAKVPVRFWLEVGLLEGASMVATNRHLRDVLVAKGYDVTYSEHTYDHWWPSWLGTLPDPLTWITAPWG